VSLPERELIARIRKAAGRGRASGLVRGIGDDCAVLRVPAGHEALITTDFSLEGVHFRREWHPPESVGHRCLTRGLSDIAAMGGEPLAAFLSMALPTEVEQQWVDGFLRGFLRLARKFNVALAGGDTAQSPSFPQVSARKSRARTWGTVSLGPALQGAILADVIVLGSLPRGKAVLRSGAKIGDDIFVTGTLGGSAAVLNRFMSSAIGLRSSAMKVNSERTQKRSPRVPHPERSEGWGFSLTDGRKPIAASTERAHFFPTPRVAVGRWLRERGLVSAMIDISDGLSTDLNHICEESDVGAWIAQPNIPVAPGATLDEALNGGDDYELLFTSRAAKHDRIPDRIAGVPIRWIGTVTRKPGMWLVAPDMKSRQPLLPRGWEHLSSSTR
jgi:thiamine-monophosphate kinase